MDMVTPPTRWSNMAGRYIVGKHPKRFTGRKFPLRKSRPDCICDMASSRKVVFLFF